MYKEAIQKSIEISKSFLRTYLPHVKVSQEPYRIEPCSYTMAPDSHWIIDKDPKNSRLYFACGFSGHGFKCAPSVGELLAKMVLGETIDSNYNLNFFSAQSAKKRVGPS